MSSWRLTTRIFGRPIPIRPLRPIQRFSVQPIRYVSQHRKEENIEEEDDEDLDDDLYEAIHNETYKPELEAILPTPGSVAILGGGITGLSTAFYLAKLNPDIKIDLFEKSNRLGGWMQTTVKKDLESGMPVYLENGPKTLRSLGTTATRADDFILADLLSSLGLVPAVATAGAKFVLDQRPPLTAGGPTENHLLRVPPPLVVKQLLHPAWRGWAKSVVVLWLLTLKVKLGLVRAPTVADDMSVAAWLRSLGIGKEKGAPMAESMLSAMAHGIYGGSLENLSVQSFLGPRLFKLYQEVLDEGHQRIPAIEGVIMEEFGEDEDIVEFVKYMGNGESLMFPGGMNTLIKALEDVLSKQENVTIHKETEVKALYPSVTGEGITIESKKSNGPMTESTYDRAVSTIFSRHLFNIARPAYDSLMPGLPSLEKAQAVSVANISFYFPSTLPLPENYTGVLPLPSVPGPVLGVFVSSNLTGPTVAAAIRPHEAPGTVIHVLVGGAHWDGLTKEVLSSPEHLESATETAKSFLKETLCISETPTITNATMSLECIPQHPVGHQATMAQLHKELSEVYGNYLSVAGGSYTGIGVLPSISAAHGIARMLTRDEDPEVWSQYEDMVGYTGLAMFEDGLYSIQKWMVIEDTQLENWGKRTRLTDLSERDKVTEKFVRILERFQPTVKEE